LRLNPTITVLVAYYNGADFIQNAIESVARQSVKPDELVLVDDCSSDFNEAAIRAAYPHGCLKIVKHASNLGLASSRNTGVAASTGDYLLPLDQDDILDSTFIEKTAPLLSDPFVDGIYSYVQLFGDRTDLWCPDITLTNLMAGSPPPSSIIFKKELFDKVGGFRNCCNSPDSDFWLRALSLGCTLKSVAEPLIKYRKHSASLSERTKQTEICDLFDHNSTIYHQNLPFVISQLQARLNASKDEYSKLEKGFQDLERGYFELLERYDGSVSELQNLSIRQRVLAMVDKISTIYTRFRA